MRKAIFLHILAFILLLMPTYLVAQPQTNGYETGDGDPDPENVPFDDWVIVLVTVGLAYGIKKALAAKRHERKQLIIVDNIKKENMI